MPLRVGSGCVGRKYPYKYPYLGINNQSLIYHGLPCLDSGDQSGLTTPTDPLGAGPIPL